MIKKFYTRLFESGLSGRVEAVQARDWLARNVEVGRGTAGRGVVMQDWRVQARIAGLEHGQ